MAESCLLPEAGMSACSAAQLVLTALAGPPLLAAVNSAEAEAGSVSQTLQP